MHGLTDLEIAALVAVAQAHGIRTQARRSARLLKKGSDEAGSSVRAAESGARLFGNYGDCGDEYNGEYRNAKAANEAVQPLFNDAVMAEIEAEKNYTRVKHQALERYPALMPHIDRLLLVSNAPVSEVAA